MGNGQQTTQRVVAVLTALGVVGTLVAIASAVASFVFARRAQGSQIVANRIQSEMLALQKSAARAQRTEQGQTQWRTIIEEAKTRSHAGP